MKKLIPILMFLFAGLQMKAQTKVIQKADTLVEVVAPVTFESLTSASTLTTQVFKAKDGVTYPVYRSKEGKLFIVKQSKTTGRYYRQYLTVSSL